MWNGENRKGLSFRPFSSVASCEALTASEPVRTLYPPIEPYRTGTLSVSNLHTIYYEEYGNPKGKPVLFVHGGPGAGTSPKAARFFDPLAYRIILVDQRGCGKSTPFAEIEQNSTWDSVQDFEKLRKLLGIERWMVFGGSWGSTLSLTYAMEHPERVTELVLRGIFLLRKKEINWYYQSGADAIFPDVWEGYKQVIPEEEQGDFVKAYRRRLTGELGAEEMQRAAVAWAVWEGMTSNLQPPDASEVSSKHGSTHYSLAFSRIENHYFSHGAFFPRDGYLLEKENIDKIRHIPTTIVQGRYDVVCPMMSAYDLKKAFPEADLKVTVSGHSAFEPGNTHELVKATDRLKYDR
ncbi:PIP [Symbiodinium microadriaticum]|nr:PIP [Symbiodinium microadriaticum]